MAAGSLLEWAGRFYQGILLTGTTDNDGNPAGRVVVAPTGVAYDSNANTDVGTSTELISTFAVSGVNTLSVEAAVTVQDLNAFEIYVRRGTTGTYQLIASTSADYTSPSGYLESVGRITTATGS